MTIFKSFATINNFDLLLRSKRITIRRNVKSKKNYNMVQIISEIGF